MSVQRRSLLVAGLASPAAQAATCGRPLRLQVPANEPNRDFLLQLLAAALEAGGCTTAVTAQPGDEGGADVTLLGSLAEAPAGSLVVREPLRRGLPGLRLLVTPLARVQGLSDVGTLAELKRRCVVGVLATDAALAEYRRQGLRTATAPTLGGLYELLRRGEADVLSRGVAEAWGEIDSGELGRAELMALPRLALNLPMDDFFAVRADAQALHTAIATGLRVLQRNASYRRLFDAAHGLALRRSGLIHREVITLPALRPDMAITQAQALLLRSN